MVAAAVALGVALIATVALFSIFVWVERLVIARTGWTIENGHDIAALTVAIVVAGVGVYVPYQIDSGNRRLQAELLCFNSAVSFRRSITDLRLGYRLNKNEPDRRLNDWDSVSLELENTKFACRRTSVADSGQLAKLEEVDAQFASERDKASRNEMNPDYVGQLDTWAVSAMGRLSADGG